MDPEIEMMRPRSAFIRMLAMALPLLSSGMVRSQDDLVLSEIDAVGNSQWIELQNLSQTQSVSLGSYAVEVSDINGDNRADADLPAIELAPGAFFCVFFEGSDFCVEGNFVGIAHEFACLPFTLRSLCPKVEMSRTGGRVRLLRNGTETENLRYPPLPGGGTSYCRQEAVQGKAEWCVCLEQTRGERNRECLLRSPLVINEVAMGDADDPGSCGYDACPDWAEIYNWSDQPWNLTEFQLEDTNNEFQFHEQIVAMGRDPRLQPRERIVVLLRGRANRHPMWPADVFLADFGLSSAGDALTLRSTAYGFWDSIAIPPLDNTTCLARVPDGDPRWQFVDTCTPDLPNLQQGGDVAPRVTLEDRFPLRVVPRPDGVPDTEPIEIYARVLDSNDDLDSVELIVSGPFFPMKTVKMEPGRLVTCVQTLRRELGVFVGRIERPTMSQFQAHGEGFVDVTVVATDLALHTNNIDESRHSVFVQSPDWTPDPAEGNLHKLRINEVAADERLYSTGDWVEIHNPTDEEIKAGLLHVTDNILELDGRRLPGNVRIDPRGYLRVWTDGETLAGDGDTHLPFQLNDCRDEVILVHRDGKHVIDVVSFHEEHLELTLGRYPDGAETGEAAGVLSIMAPTPGEPNRLITCVDVQTRRNGDHPVINEVMADNWDSGADAGGENGDWVEIYNPTRHAVSLDGWSLRDSSLEPWFFPPRTAIDPGCHLLVWCDNDVECENNLDVATACGANPVGELHTDFELSREFEFVQLVDRCGNVVDCWTIRFQARDVSTGRLPDGSATPKLLIPTPGAPNEVVHEFLELQLDCAATKIKLQELIDEAREQNLDLGILRESQCVALDPAVECEEALFLRGDADGSCKVNLADAVVLLAELFGGGTELPCRDAADTNDDGTLNLTDAVFVLNHLFSGGPAPNAPGIDVPGPDPTDDELDCLDYQCD